MTVIALRRKDGSREFDCRECGLRVHQAVYVQRSDALCFTCEWMIRAEV